MNNPHTYHMSCKILLVVSTLAMFIGSPTSIECDQVCWHITDGSNIHDLKSQMQHLNPWEQLSFLKDMSQIISRREDREFIGLLAIGKQTNKDLEKEILRKINTQLNGTSLHMGNTYFKVGVSLDDKSFDFEYVMEMDKDMLKGVGFHFGSGYATTSWDSVGYSETTLWAKPTWAQYARKSSS